MSAAAAHKAGLPVLHTQGLVLARVGTGESHQRLTLLSPTHGRLMCLQRMGAKATDTRADLFDMAELVLEGPQSAGFYFVKEYALLLRYQGIGRSYAALTHASEFVEILAHNCENTVDCPQLVKLAHTALLAWESGVRPEVAAFKALALLAQNEGYALREDFIARLPEAEHALSMEMLRLPLNQQTLSPQQAETILHALHEWMKAFTDIWMPR